MGWTNGGCSEGGRRPLPSPAVFFVFVGLGLVLARRRGRALSLLLVASGASALPACVEKQPITDCFCDPGYTCAANGACVSSAIPDYFTIVDFSVVMHTPDLAVPPDLTVTPDLTQLIDAKVIPDVAAPPCAPACAANQFCVNGRCTGCRDDADCPLGEICRSLGMGLGVSECSRGCVSDQRCGGGAMKCCGGQCADVGIDSQNCGTCGNACTFAHAAAQCVGGVCQAGACDPGWGDCNQDAKDGCEVSLLTSTSNCTACGMKCQLFNAIAGCAAGCFIAACAFGFDDCNADPKDGCETAVLSDVKNCGACGKACAALAHAKAACQTGACQLTSCDAGYADCDRNAANGCEVATNTDANNCGACGNRCPQGLVCLYGSCTCPMCNVPNARTKCINNQCFFDSCVSGYADCNKNQADGCEVNVYVDPKNCGTCGTVCPVNLPVCASGTCSA